MATNDFLTFAADPAANVMTQANYAAGGFTARLLGFSTGTALSLQLNKVWRQASQISRMIAQFTVDEVAQDMLDDGSTAGQAALLARFRAAVVHVAQVSITGYLPIAGGTLTGPLQINSATFGQTAPAASAATYTISRQAGQPANILARTNTSPRWQIVLANTALEQGTNSGSNFDIQSYNDGGSLLDTPISISRSTGIVNFTHNPTVNGGLLPYLPIAGGVLTGNLGVGGVGINYPALGGNWSAHRTAFGWDDSFIIAAVDGTYVGQLATVAWSQGRFGSYLPLAGGTVTGPVAINSSLTVAGQGGFAGTVYFSGLSDFANFYGSSRYRYRQWAGSWYDYWDGQTGQRGWVCYTNGGMYLDGSANLTTTGYIHANGGRLLSQGWGASVGAYSPDHSMCTGFWTDGSGMWLGNLDGAGNPFSAKVRIDPNGYVSIFGSGQSNGTWHVGGALTCASAGFYVNGSMGAIWGDGNSGAWRILGTYPNFQQIGVLSYGNVLVYNTMNRPDGGGAWNCDINGQTTQAAASVATNFVAYSDDNLKVKVEPWTTGLDAVLKIEPISYEFREGFDLGEPGVKLFGVSAQAIRAMLPEAVVNLPRYLKDGTEEVLGVEASTIFYACVNAIKELAARLAAAETKLQELTHV